MFENPSLSLSPTSDNGIRFVSSVSPSRSLHFFDQKWPSNEIHRSRGRERGENSFDFKFLPYVWRLPWDKFIFNRWRIAMKERCWSLTRTVTNIEEEKNYFFFQSFWRWWKFLTHSFSTLLSMAMMMMMMMMCRGRRNERVQANFLGDDDDHADETLSRAL